MGSSLAAEQRNPYDRKQKENQLKEVCLERREDTHQGCLITTLPPSKILVIEDREACQKVPNHLVDSFNVAEGLAAIV